MVSTWAGEISTEFRGAVGAEPQLSKLKKVWPLNQMLRNDLGRDTKLRMPLFA